MAEGAPPTAAAVANDSFPVFAHLPVELMVRIVEYLSPRDIARLHCVARALQSSLLDERSINDAMTAYRQLHDSQDSQGARTRALLRNLVTRPWNTPILDLTGNRIGDRGLSAFAGAVTSGALPQLTELRLDWNRIGDAGVEALAKACASGSLPPLGGLFLNTNQIGDAGATALAGVCASGALPQLTLIDLAFNRIGDDGLNAFALAVASGALPHLTTLALSSNSIGDRGMQSLADACARGAMPQLTKLYLAGNQIGDAGITALAAACGRGGLPQLTTLYLFSNKIGDAGVTALAGACASGSLPQLTLLSLGSNRIGDDGLSALAGAVASGAALASLRTLWLHENKIGDEALIAFSEALGKGALPKCIDIYLLRNPASREAQQAVKDAIKNRSTWSWRAAPSVGPSSSSPLAQEVIEHMAEGAPPTAAVAKDAKSPRVDDSFPDVFARLPDDLMARILREARAIEVAVARTHPDPGPYWAGPCSQLFARVRQLHISRESAWLHWRTMPISSLDTGPLAASPTEAAERGVAELYNGSRTAHYCGITTVARNPFIRDLRTFIPDEVRILARDLVCRPLAYSAEGWASLRASGPPAPDRVFAARGEANAQNVMQAVNKGCRDRVARIRVAAAATAAPSVGPSSSSPLAQEVIEHMAEGAPPTAAAVANDSFPVFAHLPVELMVRIVEYLSPRDIARLHCVARALQSSLLDERSINDAMTAYRQLHDSQDSQGARTRALLRNLVTRPWNTPTLYLTGNGIGDGGLSAFAGAVASGALPQLTTLCLVSNKFGDKGMIAFSEALGKGALPQLTRLDLEHNGIGDAGIMALVAACGRGALASLQVLGLGVNQIGDAGATACGNGSLPQLKVRSHPYLCTHEHSTHPYNLSHSGAESLEQQNRRCWRDCSGERLRQWVVDQAREALSPPEPDWRCWRHGPRGRVRQWVPAAAH